MTVYAIRDKESGKWWQYDERRGEAFSYDSPIDITTAPLSDAIRVRAEVADAERRPESDFEIVAFTLTEVGPVQE